MNFFTVGSKFSSYEALEAALNQYKKETGVEFIIRDSKRLQRMMHHNNQKAFKANKSLLYYRLKLACARGGRPFVSRGIGLRKKQSWVCGCEAFIDLRLSACCQYLQVKAYYFEHNHEITPRPLTRIEYRTEKRRLRLIEKLKISYAEAAQLDNAKQKLVQEKKNSVSKEGNKGIQRKNYRFSNTENDNAKKKDEYVLIENNNAQKKDEYVLIENNNAQKKDEYVLIENNNAQKKDEYVLIENNNAQKKDEYVLIENNNAQNKEDPASNEDNNNAGNDDNFSKEESDNVVNVKDDKATYVSSTQQPQIYTRDGDCGMSSTFNGNLKQKDDSIFEALGTIEELSSAIGFAVEFLPESCDSVKIELREIQCVLQDLVVRVGTPKSSSTPFHEANCEFPDSHITNLEFCIAKHVERLPQLDSIILPSGGKGSCSLHVARTICRRAERRVVCLVRSREVDETAVRYLNRLGDYLFVAARVVCLASGEKECIYKKPELRQKGYEIIYLSRLTQSIA